MILRNLFWSYKTFSAKYGHFYQRENVNFNDSFNLFITIFILEKEIQNKAATP